MRNSNVSSKIPTMVRKMKKWFGIHIWDRITTKS